MTPLGAFCFSHGKTPYEMPEMEKRPLFNVLPNLDVVVTDSAAFSIADAAQLTRFSKQTSDSVWKINKPSILKALADGDSQKDILAVLQAGTANELPRTVIQCIEEVAQRSARVSLCEDAKIITFCDEETAVLIEHESKMKSIILGRMGKTIIIRTGNLKKFQAELRKMGILLP